MCRSNDSYHFHIVRCDSYSRIPNYYHFTNAEYIIFGSTLHVCVNSPRFFFSMSTVWNTNCRFTEICFLFAMMHNIRHLRTSPIDFAVKLKITILNKGRNRMPKTHMNCLRMYYANESQAFANLLYSMERFNFPIYARIINKENRNDRTELLSSQTNSENDDCTIYGD